MRFSRSVFAVFLFVLYLSGCATSSRIEKPAEEAGIPSEVAGQKEKTAVVVEPEREDVYESVGSYLLAGDPVKAIEAYETALSANPEDPTTLVLYAKLLFSAGEIPKAKETLADILAAHPSHEDALFNLALIEGFEGNKKEQKRLLENLLKVHPEHAEANAAIGELFLENKDLKKAKESFQKSLDKDPSNIVALIGMGNLHMRQSELDKAKSFLDRAVNEAPDYAFAYTDRSRVRESQNDTKGALEDISKAIELAPDYVWNYIDRAKLNLRYGSRSEALKDLNIAVSMDPGIFVSYVYRAGIYDELDRLEEALADYRTVIRLKPEYYFAYSAAGIILYKNGEFAVARDMFLKASMYEKQEYSYPLLVALCYKKEKREQDAKKYLAQAINSLPRQSLYYDMARFYMDPSYDGFIVSQVNKEKSPALKAKMLFYLAAQYSLNERMLPVAQKYFLETKDKLSPDTLEYKLAVSELARFQ